VFTLPQASQPALTSDGKRLAYHSWNPQGFGLFAVSTTGSGSRNVLSRYQESQRPRWGPDDQAIVFSFLQHTDDGDTKTVKFSDDDLSPSLPQSGFAQAAAWTPDNRLVFNACQRAQCGLAIANTNGSGFTFLTDRPTDLAPAVSPDGEWIAYTSQQDGNWDVYRISTTGGQSVRLTTQPGKDGIPTWSPDGSYIAYASEQNGQWAIWAMTPDGDDKRKLLDLPGSLEGKVPEFPDNVQPGWVFETISWSR
ncbi:MAG: hypothetical protein D6796_05095, partial [Caldilineae bacterium]